MRSGGSARIATDLAVPLKMCLRRPPRAAGDPIALLSSRYGSDFAEQHMFFVPVSVRLPASSADTELANPRYRRSLEVCRLFEQGISAGVPSKVFPPVGRGPGGHEAPPILGLRQAHRTPYSPRARRPQFIPPADLTPVPRDIRRAHPAPLESIPARCGHVWTGACVRTRSPGLALETLRVEAQCQHYTDRRRLACRSEDNLAASP